MAAGEPWALALPEFLDTFYLALRGGHAIDPQGCIDATPGQVRDPRHHAYFGAIGEHLARRWHLTVPSWTNDTSRILAQPTFDLETSEARARLHIESPQAFHKRNIFTESEPLRRARFPRRELHARDMARGWLWTPAACAGVYGAEATAAAR
jgi:hypothetical protein